jgi:lysophospholipase L1-like esterase
MAPHPLLSLTLWLSLAFLIAPGLVAATPPSPPPLRIMPLGDSITRGTYLVQHPTGPHQGKSTGLANPLGGGWRKTLQDLLRNAGVAFDFVGELNYGGYGRDGTNDPSFDPDHHGLAGFGNRRIITGGTVPTPLDVLEHLGVTAVTVPDLATVLRTHRPDVILLLAGANGFDAAARDELIRFIGEHSRAHLFVATILPQYPPRQGGEQVDPYNASLPAAVAASQATGNRVTLVEMHRKIDRGDLMPDGVHPNAEGMAKMAQVWFDALQAAGCLNPAPPAASP